MLNAYCNFFYWFLIFTTYTSLKHGWKFTIVFLTSLLYIYFTFELSYYKSQMRNRRVLLINVSFSYFYHLYWWGWNSRKGSSQSDCQYITVDVFFLNGRFLVQFVKFQIVLPTLHTEWYLCNITHLMIK